MVYYFFEVLIILFLINIVVVLVVGVVVLSGLLYFIFLVFNIDILLFKWFLEVCVKVLMYFLKLFYVGFLYVKFILWDEKLIFCYYFVVVYLIFKNFMSR